MKNSHTPKVSIGLPVYNGENYLKEAIESHLSQSYEDFELFLSDNASTDGTQDICEHYAKQDERIQYIR
ncbi:glycosyltransferase family 2 protein, partial [Salmonella enterica]|uniref:glycosyltransferase family 2 protein n=1 Tax=Salmonella enterica TaxID=28901 RepID=UPI0032974884